MSGHVFAFIVKLEVKPESCQAHFGISHDSLDALHVSKIVQVECAGGRLCTFQFLILFLNVFLYQLMMICANVSMWCLFRTGYIMTEPGLILVIFIFPLDSL